MSLVTPSSKGLDNLRPRAAPLGFCEVLQTVWACTSGLISTVKRSISCSSPELASRWCAWGLVSEIRFQSFKIPFKFTFHGVFPHTQDHIFCSDSYGGSVKFYRNTTQILWLLPFANSGDKLWPVTKVSRDFKFFINPTSFKKGSESRSLPKDGEFKTQPVERKFEVNKQQNQQIPTSSFPLPPPTLRTYC